MVSAFVLPEPAITPVHQLRRSLEGIQYLENTGRFKEYMAEWRDNKYREFLAWDGEGWTDTDGEHRYDLFMNSTGAHIAAPQLSSVECIEFVIRTARLFPKRIHVGFGFGYDTAHILRDMPLEKRRTLKETGTVKWFVRASQHGPKNQYTFQYIPHKWFTITGWDWIIRKNVTVKIFDVMTFFQSSFIGALQSRNIEIPDIIKSGKAGRADFKYSDVLEVREYCLIELELTVKLCNQLRSEFHEANIAVTQWHGPGAVANVIFKQNKIREHMKPPTLAIERAAQRAYFGGRFEQFKAGHHGSKVYVYDINSAYPFHIRNLPSLRNSRWVYSDRFVPGIGVWECSYEYSLDSDSGMPHPLPWRGKGGVVGFPAQVEKVWLWSPEAVHATHIHGGWYLEIGDDSKPFDFVEKMYRIRKQWKAEGKGGERAYKLALNSLYGKMAQRVGGSEKYGGRPQWHQLEWAGLVTSSVRAQIWEAIQQAPEHIIAVETDSIASTVPLDLDIGEGLGQWEATEYDWLTYVQSGIYFASDGSKGQKAKTRGIDMKQLHHKDVLAFMDGKHDGPLLVKTRQFHGLTSPATWNYGNWQDGVKEVKIAGAKRIHMEANCPACWDGLPMSQHMHTLTANPLYGHAESLKHSLPWLDDGELSLSHDLEKIQSDAIADWETSTRHNGLDGNLAEIPF